MQNGSLNLLLRMRTRGCGVAPGLRAGSGLSNSNLNLECYRTVVASLLFVADFCEVDPRIPQHSRTSIPPRTTADDLLRKLREFHEKSALKTTQWLNITYTTTKRTGAWSSGLIAALPAPNNLNSSGLVREKPENELLFTGASMYETCTT